MDSNPERKMNNLPGSNKILMEKVSKFVVFVLLLVALTMIVTMKYETTSEVSEDAAKDESQTNADMIKVDQEVPISENNTSEDVKIVRNVVKHPTCPRSYSLIIFEQMCTDLFIKRELCTPEDFYNIKKHKMPRRRAQKRAYNSNKEANVPAIINYTVGGLLILSVGAALLELYKAKKQSPDGNGKHPLSRKCSLADLTVMKHQRKELIRRESIMEIPEEGSHTKPPGFAPPPLQRRCSFPVGPNARSFDTQRASIDAANSTEAFRRISIVEEERICQIEERRDSISAQSRRTSIDSRNVSFDGRRLSVDDSPERRHHRLVYRH